MTFGEAFWEAGELQDLTEIKFEQNGSAGMQKLLYESSGAAIWLTIDRAPQVNSK